MKRVYVLDGKQFSTFEEFTAHFSAVVLKDYDWKGNLDAFGDVLRGGFGTPDEGFAIEWRHHSRSQIQLGHSAAALRYERLLKTCHPSNVATIRAELAEARQGRGPTLFDQIVEIIRDHGPGGSEAEDGVDLILS